MKKALIALVFALLLIAQPIIGVAEGKTDADAVAQETGEGMTLPAARRMPPWMAMVRKTSLPF